MHFLCAKIARLYAHNLNSMEEWVFWVLRYHLRVLNLLIAKIHIYGSLHSELKWKKGNVIFLFFPHSAGPFGVAQFDFFPLKNADFSL